MRRQRQQGDDTDDCHDEADDDEGPLGVPLREPSWPSDDNSTPAVAAEKITPLRIAS
jgi:hypothetical protein